MIRITQWWRGVAVLVAGLVLRETPLAAQRTTPPTAFVDVAVIPMDTERVLLHQTVVVQDGRIIALGPKDAIKVPAGAQRIKGRGKYLVPGFADMHTHISRYGPQAIDIALFTLVANGVTTIRDVEFSPKSKKPNLPPDGYTWQHVQLEGPTMFRLRREIAEGKRWGPRMYLSGPWDRDSTKSVRDNLTAYKAAGYDHIKLYQGFGLIEPSPAEVGPKEKPKQQRIDSVIVVARELGLPLASHGVGDFSATLRLGLKSIEHGLASSPEVIAATIRDSIWVVPTPHLTNTTLGSLACRYIRADASMLFPMPPLTYVLGVLGPRDSSGTGEWLQLDRGLKVIHDAGVGLLTGSDSPFLLTGYTIPRQFQAFVRAGLTPYQSLAIGTRNPARYFGTLDSTGTVTVGKRADLVLLAGNPLEDIRHANDIAGVMVQGRWMDRAFIEQELDRLHTTLLKLKPVPPKTTSATCDSLEKTTEWKAQP